MADRTAEASGLWVEAARDGWEKGVFRPDLPPEVVAHLLQSTAWSMAQWLRSGRVFDPDEAADRIVDGFVRGIAVPGAYQSRDLGAVLAAARPSCPGGGIDPALLVPVPARIVFEGSDARTRIMIAASGLFAQQGFARTTTRQDRGSGRCPGGQPRPPHRQQGAADLGDAGRVPRRTPHRLREGRRGRGRTSRADRRVHRADRAECWPSTASRR
ncbi:hypothetical protein ACU686_31910 [Yinghuangia aomiensis]